MTIASGIAAATPAARTAAASRDSAIDSMRGAAILMVIGIHSLQQPLSQPWQIMLDSALRPCVPIFLFASGYLTSQSGRVPLGKRLMAALLPYTLAFAAAYLYMALQNPAMDHRPSTTMARYLLAYVFVYYYVFVYLGCTLMLWLLLRLVGAPSGDGAHRLPVALALAIAVGLTIGSYLDPLLQQRGFSDGLVEEIRMRDIPFWFGFVALGMLAGGSGIAAALRRMRGGLLICTLLAYGIYAAARMMRIGDFAAYDSVAFFGYAAALCLLLFALRPRLAFLAMLGAGSYFIYLWHIFVVMALRDHGGLRAFGPAAATLVTFLITATVICAALVSIQRWAPPRLARLLGT